MQITDIGTLYEKFSSIGCLTFATVDEDGFPQARIAHLRAYDEDGIYFMTMHTKSFYRQLTQNCNVALCGLNAQTQVTHDANGMPVFHGGYAIRFTGAVKEVPMEEIKAKKNPMFDMCIKDQIKYPAMVVFCITSGHGDIFDYDFKGEHRDYKLERIYLSLGGETIRYRGLIIDQDACIACGLCQKKCSFKAILCEEKRYRINRFRCDECGDCYLHCPVKAIHTKA